MEWFLAAPIPSVILSPASAVLVALTNRSHLKCLYHEKICLSEMWLLEVVPVKWEVSLEVPLSQKHTKSS